MTKRQTTTNYRKSPQTTTNHRKKPKTTTHHRKPPQITTRIWGIGSETRDDAGKPPQPPPEYEKKYQLSIFLVENGQSTQTCRCTFPFMQSARIVDFHIKYVSSFFLHRKALACGQLLRLCMCVVPPIEYT